MNNAYSLTLIASKIPNEALVALEQISQKQAIELSKPVHLSDGNKLGIQALRYEFHRKNNAEPLHEDCREFSQQWQLDSVVQAKRESTIKLACFDMDSTLIQAEVIDMLAAHAGVGEQVAEITEQAMQGKLDFNQSFTQRMGLLKGLDANVIKNIIEEIPIMDGAERLFKNLDKHNVRSAILSGGFEVFANHLQQRFKIKTALANTLQVNAGQLTGVVMPPIINAEQKRSALIELCQQYGISESDTMAVGDGANDLKMINTAGLGVAFRAKPIVQEQATAALNYNGLDALLFLMGFSEQDIDA